MIVANTILLDINIIAHKIAFVKPFWNKNSEKIFYILLLTNILKRGIIVSTGGEAVEDSIGGRIASLRKKLEMTQEEFAKSLCMSRSNLSNIEKDRFTITDRVIDTICAKFGVNEQWLRTGEGEMFPPMTTDMKVAKLFGGIMKEDLSEFKQELLEKYANFIVNLTEDEAKVLIKMLDNFFENRSKTKEKK